MFIRGIDFARHNVIVGTEQESPIPTQQFRPQQGGHLVARVVGLTGSEATLDINGQRVVVETHVALNLGDKIYVKVAEAAGNTLRLSILASEPEGAAPEVPDSTIDGLLAELGVPADERTRQAARALLARDGTIDKAALQKLLADLRGTPQVTAREAGAAALLQKANVPVNAVTMELLLSRAEPESPPQLAARLAPLAPALEALRRQLPANSQAGAIAKELTELLKGLPLDERAVPHEVEQGLRKWLSALTPSEAQARAAKAQSPQAPPSAAAGEPAEASEPAAPLHKSLGTPEPAAPATGRSAVADLMKNLGRLSGPEQAPAPEAPAGPRPAAPKPQVTEHRMPPEGAQQASKQGMERADRVLPSQNILERMGISTKVPEPGKADLASMLDRLTQALGSEHKGLKSLLREAAAEVRYTQLVNAPPTAPQADRAEFLIPLMVPQLSPDQPEGRIQVFHRQTKKGEPIDPHNVRLVFVLHTEHLGTVQADVAIKDGAIDLTVGVPDVEDKQFLAAHLDELEEAIARLGWETGRFGTRVAKGLPPRVRQEEGLTDVVQFDRRV